MNYYREVLNRSLEGCCTAIHLGAGGKEPKKLTDVDLTTLTLYALDPSVRSLRRNSNPNKVVAWGHEIPFPGSSIDVIFSEHVVEHIADPESTLAEARRVLRPGGLFIWVAPNLWSYSGLITHFTPCWFHKLITRLLEPISSRRAREDVFPTHFRLNSIPRIKRLLGKAHFQLLELYTTADAPHYTQIFPIIHQCAVLWHILMDQLEILRFTRPVQIVIARR